MSGGSPAWLRHDYTGDIIDAMAHTTCESLPTANPSPDALRIINILNEAGLCFRGRWASFDRHVPVATVIISDQQSGESIPSELSRTLSQNDHLKADVLRNTLITTSRSRPAQNEMKTDGEAVNWQLAQIIASRLDMYRSILGAGEDVGALSRALAVSFVSTLLGIADASLSASGNSSPLAHVFVGCPAFVISAAATDLGAPLGIGVIALIGTLENWNECYSNLRPALTQLKSLLYSRLANESHARQLADLINTSRSRGATYYDRNGSQIDFKTAPNTTVDRVDTTDVTHSQIDVSAQGERCGVARQSETGRAEGGSDRTMSYDRCERNSDGVEHFWRGPETTVEHVTIP